jgi:cysteine-rich repeat protein
MDTFRKCLVFVAALCAPLLGLQANAATMWSTVAALCTPDHSSIQGNRYKVIDKSAVTFAGKSIKKITLNCPVVAQSGMKGPEALSMTFKDSTGNLPSGRLAAGLIRNNRLTGVSEQVAELTSDTTAATGIQQLTDPSLDPETFDFDTYAYFVRVVMTRSTASKDVRLYSLRLTTTCGNGMIGFGEVCDDGDTDPGDGCASTCVVEDGYQCSGTPSACFPDP